MHVVSNIWHSTGFVGFCVRPLVGSKNKRRRKDSRTEIYISVKKIKLHNATAFFCRNFRSSVKKTTLHNATTFFCRNFLSFIDWCIYSTKLGRFITHLGLRYTGENGAST